MSPSPPVSAHASLAALAQERSHDLQDSDALRRIYTQMPGDTSLAKVVDHVHPLYRPFIEHSPFAVMATRGPHGLDTSPRGDGPGFVCVADEKTLLLPDRRGNGRIDSLRNIVFCPEVALLFLLPGCGETLRVNGTGRISASPALCAAFEVQGKRPQSVLVVTVASVYFQCARALQRSRLWDPARRISRQSLPSTGSILQGLSEQRIDGAAYDAALPVRQRDTLY